jgi:hypothetical protein
MLLNFIPDEPLYSAAGTVNNIKNTIYQITIIYFNFPRYRQRSYVLQGNDNILASGVTAENVLSVFQRRID